MCLFVFRWSRDLMKEHWNRFRTWCKVCSYIVLSKDALILYCYQVSIWYHAHLLVQTPPPPKKKLLLKVKNIRHGNYFHGDKGGWCHLWVGSVFLIRLCSLLIQPKMNRKTIYKYKKVCIFFLTLSFTQLQAVLSRWHDSNNQSDVLAF